MGIEGIGVDIVEIERFKKIIEKYGEKFIKRVFHEKEISSSHSINTLAGKFAGKEAIMKMLGTGWRGIKWREIKILKSSHGKPYVELEGNAKKICEDLGIKRIQVSISHVRTLACAFVIGET